MKRYLIGFVAVLLSYLILDGIWLGLVAKDAYLDALQGRLRMEYPIAPWAVFYLLYSAILVHLVVINDLNKSVVRCFFDGCLFGLAAYGAYNLTNYAILADWPLMITLKDWAWGTAVSGVICVSGWLALKKFA